MTPANPRVLLNRMEAAHRETRYHLDRVHRQIAGRAERIAVTQNTKARHRARKRSGSRWSRNDEMLFQTHLDRLQFERWFELDGLVGRLARQSKPSTRCGRHSAKTSGAKAA